MEGIKVGQMLEYSCWIATEANAFLALIILCEKCGKRRQRNIIISYWLLFSAVAALGTLSSSWMKALATCCDHTGDKSSGSAMIQKCESFALKSCLANIHCLQQEIGSKHELGTNVPALVMLFW